VGTRYCALHDWQAGSPAGRLAIPVLLGTYLENVKAHTHQVHKGAEQQLPCDQRGLAVVHAEREMGTGSDVLLTAAEVGNLKGRLGMWPQLTLVPPHLPISACAACAVLILICLLLICSTPSTCAPGYGHT
jgi:hypothetical protein